MPGMADAPRMYRLLHRLMPRVVTPYLRVRTEGIENVPEREPAVLASNHLSFIDSIVLPLNVRRPVYFLGKSDYWDSWRTRWFFEGTGMIPVHRGGGPRGEDSIRAGVEVLTSGDLLGIYPEGTRSPDGRLYRGKTGPVRIALEAQVPVIPCAVWGTAEAMPPGASLPRRGEVRVRYGRPLDLSRHHAGRNDPLVLRTATDELMREIMLLSGQEYVDEYAARVKSGEARGAGGDEPGSERRSPGEPETDQGGGGQSPPDDGRAAS